MAFTLSETYLLWPDYLILVAFLVISLGIGVYHSLTGGRQGTTVEFIMANRSLKVLPTALSLLVSFQSAITILGYTAEMYSYGSNVISMTFVSITVAIVLTVLVVVPWMYPMKLVSVNEYFERRFQSKSVRILASVISIFTGVLYMGMAMYAPSAALESATGLPISVSIPVMAVVSVAYTALGGMRAVIWTDVFQCAIMIGGMLAILIKGVIVVGGFGNVFRLCSQTDRWNWVGWSPDPTVRHTGWGFLLGSSAGLVGLYGFSQASVQRYSATKTQSQAILAVVLNLPAFCVSTLLAGLIGLVVVSYYASIGCDPLVMQRITNANQLLPHFVLKMFSNTPGFAGLFLATLYGGALSSISSSLSGAAANCWEDILQWKLMHLVESRKALLNRFLVVLFGVAAAGVAFIASVVPGPITQICISLGGATIGPLCGMFLLGGLNRYANAKGALIGGITSLIGSVWLIIGAFTLKRKYPTLPPLSIDGCMASGNHTFTSYDDINSSSVFHFTEESPINATTMTYFHPQGLDNFYSISYIWYTFIWALVTLFVGSVASFLLRDKSLEEKLDEKLLMSLTNCFRCRDDVKSESTAEKFVNTDDNLNETPAL